MSIPCKDCPRKGCGTYHDECPDYKKWKMEEEDRKEKIIGHKKWYGREYIKDSTFKSRTHGVFKSTKKERH